MKVTIIVETTDRKLFKMPAEVGSIQFNNRKLHFIKDSDFYEFKGALFATTNLQEPKSIRPLFTSYALDLTMSEATLRLPSANFEFNDAEIKIVLNECEIQLIKHILKTKENYDLD